MNSDTIIAAFPQAIKEDVLVVAKALPFRKNRFNFSEQFQINIAGEVLSIPTRIYFNEMAEEQSRLFTPKQKLILYCIYTRHWDGFLREKYVRKLHSEQGFEA